MTELPDASTCPRATFCRPMIGLWTQHNNNVRLFDEMISVMTRTTQHREVQLA